MELVEEVQARQLPIEQMAMGWSLVPSQYEGDNLLEQTSGTCHIFWCISSLPVPFEAKNILGELPS